MSVGFDAEAWEPDFRPGERRKMIREPGEIPCRKPWPPPQSGDNLLVIIPDCLSEHRQMLRLLTAAVYDNRFSHLYADCN